jgi:hypothetical protein
MKISYDDEENENIMYIENNKNNLDVSYIPQDLSIIINEIKEMGKKSGVVLDIISKETSIIEYNTPKNIKKKTK